MSNVVGTGTALSESLQDAKDLIAIACTLGEEVDAVEGMGVWDVQVSNVPCPDPIRIGVYATKEGALRGLRNHIEDLWVRSGPKPEGTAEELPTASDQEIIEHFYKAYPGEKYFITRVQLKGFEPEYVRRKT